MYTIHQLGDGWYVAVDLMGHETILQEGGGPYLTREAAEEAVRQFEVEDERSQPPVKAI
jgi:hypothetical protein